MTSLRKRGKPSDDVDDLASTNWRKENAEYLKKDEGLFDERSKWRHLVQEAVLGYVWWSTFFSLPPTIWFFPLNMLEISGYEAFALLLLSPVFTLIPFVDKLICSKLGLIAMQFLTVGGLLCYQAPSAISRLLVTSFANFFAMLWLCGIWWMKSKPYKELAFGGMVIGFILKLVLRIAYVSLNPLWTSTGSNTMIFLLALACVIDRSKVIMSLKEEETDDGNEARPVMPVSTWVTVGCGLGAWFFMAQWLFAEVSIVSRYTGTAFPSLSILPVPGGVFVLAALVIGLTLSTQDFIRSSAWWIFGCLSALLFFHASSFIAFFSGLGLAVYVMSIFPLLANTASKCSKGKVLTLGLLICIIFLLASVWVVAYNFVPGGTFARERNDTIMIIAMLLMGFAAAVKVEDKKEDSSHQEVKDTRVLQGDSSKRKNETFFRESVIPALYLLLLIGVIFMFGRYSLREKNRQKAKLAVKDPKVFTSMIWTVHFGYDNKGWHSFKESVQLMMDTEADVIGILESDCSRPYVGSTDFVSYVEEKLGFYADYGPRTKDHTWGAAIISRYPIVKSEHYLLPSPEGELAPALLASVNISGQIVDFVVVHMGNDRDDLDRKLQAEQLARILDGSANPIVFLGYVTSSPGSRDYLHLLDSGRTKDIDYEDSERWCEYIFYRDLIRLGYARISHAGLSDTEVQLGKFKIPSNIKNFTDYNAVTTTADDVDSKFHFSEKFGDFHIGDFHGEGHHFHMATPKYFFSIEDQ